MRRATSIFGMLALVCTVTAGCPSAASRYVGDGRMIDGGFNFFGRYQVILGDIALDEARERRFRMAKLPKHEFVLGIRLNAGNCAAMKSDTVMKVRVTNERGEVVLGETLPLKDLSWNRGEPECAAPFPFGYVRGEGMETPLKDGGSCNRPLYTGADHGSGTYFLPRKAGVYDVVIRFEPRDSQLSYGPTAQVELHDVGAPTGSSC